MSYTSNFYLKTLGGNWAWPLAAKKGKAFPIPTLLANSVGWL